MLLDLLVMGIITAGISIAVSLFNRARHKKEEQSRAREREDYTDTEIVTDFRIWDFFVNFYAESDKEKMTQETFDSLSPEEKLQIMADCFKTRKLSYKVKRHNTSN